MNGQRTVVQQKSKHWIIKGINFISTLCGVIAALMILSSVVITCQMIWVRSVLNGSTIWQTEAVTYLMISATLIGLPYVQLLQGHVNVDLILMMLPRRIRKALAMFVLLVSILVIGIMAFHGYALFHIALDRGWRSDSVWGVNLWLPYLSLPIGFGLFVIQMTVDLFITWSEKEPHVLEHGEFEKND